MTSFGEAMRDKLETLKYPKGHIFVEWSDVYPLPIKGCTVSEISEIKVTQGVEQKNLPDIYLEFLRYLGKKSGDLFIGYDLTYFYLTKYNFTVSINRTLRQDGHRNLGENVYAFMNKQSVSHWYFHLDDGDDPAVYFYSEFTGEEEHPTKDGPIKVSNRLSEFFTSFIAERESREAQTEFLRLHTPKH